jgi:hypothetical protein
VRWRTDDDRALALPCLIVEGDPLRYGSSSFGPVSADERRRADRFFADLVGHPRRPRRAPGEGTPETWAESGPLALGPLTESEWQQVLRILKSNEADVGAPLTEDAERNALLVAARIFCSRNALRLEREDPLLCLVKDVTTGDPRVRALVPHVTARGPIIHVAGLLRAAGLTVVEHPGWRTRSSTGEGGRFEPVGVMMHHTAGLGRGTLIDIVAGVKANFFVDRAGVFTVVSGGRANHAGNGARRVLDEVRQGVAPSGTAKKRGLLPAVMGNGHFYGFENENLGDGKQPWPPVQVTAMARAAAALCRRHGWTANRVISHAEWLFGNVDPLGIDMNAFRASVAALLAAPRP